MNDQFQQIKPNEVVRFNREPVGDELNLYFNDFNEISLTDQDFMSAIKRSVSVSDETRNKLFEEGLECYVLKYGAKGWKSGKVRVKMTVEFCPDEPEVEETPAANLTKLNTPESPLDEIRQMMKEDNQ